MRISGMVFLLCCGLAAAQDDSLQWRDRYEQVLRTRPTRGVAFERLYQSYSDHEGIDAWLKKLSANAADAASLLIAGYVYERRGEEDAALQAYAESATRSKQEHRAFAARGRLLWHLRRYDEAAIALQEAIDRNPPPNELRELQKTLGRVHAAAGDSDRAVAAWLKLADLFPDDAVTLEELADLLMEEERFAEALMQYQRLHKVADDDYLKVRAAMSMAQLHVEQQQFTEAVDILGQQLATLAPDSWLRAEARRRLEQIFRDRNKSADLITFYDRWLDERPDDVEMRLALAHVHHRSGNVRQAQNILEQIVERAATRRDARAALAELHLEQGRYQQAAEAYEKLCDMAPGEARLWERLGRIYFNDLETPEAKRKKAAEQAWANILSRRPDDASRAVLTAEVMRNANLVEPAIEHYRKAIELEPDNIAHYEYLGQYLVELDRRDEALKWLNATVADQRNTPTNHVRRAEVLAGFTYDEQCLSAVDQALDLVGDGPEVFQLHSIRAAVLMRQERYDQASASLDAMARAATDYNQRHEARLARIELYEKTDSLKDEIVKLADSAKTADAFEMLALLHRAVPDRGEAVLAIEQAVALDKNNGDRLALAAEIYQQCGELQRAIALRRALIDLQPQHGIEHLEQIVDLSRRASDWGAALNAANQLIERSPDSERGYMLAADIHGQSGRTAEAIAVLRRGVRRNPRDPLLLTALGQQLQNAGRIQDAIDCYWRTYDATDQDHDKLRAAGELAKIHLQIGRFDQLVEVFNERRFDADEGNVAARALATAYTQANMPEQAHTVLHRELAKQPNDASLLDRLMSLSEELGQLEQAVSYGEKLLVLKPEDAHIKQRMGKLLYDAGRLDEAITLWRSSIAAVGRDAAETSLRLAETLTRHGLHDDALDALTNAARRAPDDWKLAYRLAVQFKTAGHRERAAALLDALIKRKVPGDAVIAKTSHGYTMSYLGFNNQSPLINQWTVLTHIQNLMANELQMSQQWGAGVFSFGASRSFYGRGANQYSPPDIQSAQLAALIHRLHLAESEGKLPEHLGQLAADAGHALRIDEKLVTPDPLPASSRDVEARLRLLRALLLTGLSDQAYDALSAFQSQSPENHDYIALQAVLHVLPRQHGFAAARPKAIAEDADPTPYIDALAAIDKQAAATLVPAYAQQLIGQGRTDEAVSWLNRSMDENDQLVPTMTVLVLLAQTGQAKAKRTALRRTVTLLPHIREHIKTTTGQQRYIPLHYLGSILATAVAADEPDTAADLLIGYLDLFAATGGKPGAKHQGWNPFRQPVTIFSLDRGEPLSFPSANHLMHQMSFEALKAWHKAMGQSDRLEGFIAKLMKRAEQDQGAARAQAVMAAAVVLGLNDQLDKAAELIKDALETHDDDRLRLVYVQLLLQQEQYDKAAAALQRIRAKIGAVATEAQVAMMHLSTHLKDKAPAIAAARRLARSRLTTPQATRLIPYLQALELQDEAQRLTQRTAKAQSGPSQSRQIAVPRGGQPAQSRRVQLLQRMMQQKNYKAAARLAKRIINEKNTIAISSNRDQEIPLAVQALKQAGELEQIIADLEAKFEKNSSSTSLMNKLWVYHTAMGRQKKAQAVLEKLFTASPNNVQVRYQFAVSLARQGNYQAAAPHFEKVIKTDPSLIQQGHMVAYAFRETGNSGKLADLIEAIQPSTARLTVMTQQGSGRNWVYELAQQMQHQDPAAALRIFRKSREMNLHSYYHAYIFTAITQIAAKLNNPQIVVDELPHLLPDKIKTKGVTPLQQYKMVGGILFTAPQNNPSPFMRMVEMLEKADKLDALQQILKKGAADENWERCIGQPASALIAIHKPQPDLAMAKLVLQPLLDAPAANDHYSVRWRAAVVSSLVEQMAENDDALPLAAKFAAAIDGKTSAPNVIQPNTQLMLLSIQARAAVKQGDREKSRNAFERITKYVNPQRRHYIGMSASQTFWIDMQEFQAKAPYVKDMIAAGFTDMAVDMLLAYETKLSGAQEHERQQFEQQVKKIVENSEVVGQLKQRAAKLRAQLDDEPEDLALAKRLMRLYQITGQTDAALELADSMGDAQLMSPATQAGLVKQMSAGKRKPQARKMALALIRDGHGSLLDGSSKLHKVFDDLASCTQLVEALEAMPRTPAAVGQNWYWIQNFSQPIRQTASGKKGEELKSLHELEIRVTQLIDQFSSINMQRQNQSYNRPYLHQVVNLMIRRKQTQDAYDYLQPSIFAADKTGMPEPSAAQLFRHSGSNNNMMQSLATMLVSLAKQTDHLDELKQQVAKRRENDGLWNGVGLRLAALIAFEQDETAQAAKLMRDVMDHPLIDTSLGYDSSIVYLIQQAARHDAMTDITREQLELVMTSVAGNRNAAGQIQSIAPLLVHTYAKMGDLDKARAAIEQAYIIMSARYQNNKEYLARQLLALCRLAGSIHRDAGRLPDALDYYRVRLRFPFHRANTLHGDSTQGMVIDVVIDMLKQLEKNGQLESYIERIEAQRKRLDNANAEPLLTIVTARIIQGQTEQARKTFDQIAPDAFLAGAPLVLRAMEKLKIPPTPDLLGMIDTMFTRAPYLFKNHEIRLLNIYKQANRTLPVNDQLMATLKSITPPTTQPSRRRGHVGANADAIIEFDGSPDVDGAKTPTEEDRAELTRQVLGKAAQHFERIKDEKALTSLMQWAYPYLDKKRFGPKWIAVIRREDPTKACDAAIAMIKNADASMSVAALFDSGVATTIIELAHEQNRLSELADACRKLTPAIARLQLIAVAAHDVKRFETMLPGFVEGKPPFQMDKKPGQADPALALLIRVSQKINPDIRPHLPQLLKLSIAANEAHVAALEKQYPDREHYFIDSKPYLLTIQMQFDAGKTDDALAACRQLLDKHVEKATRVGGIQYRGDARGDMITMAQLAIKHQVAGKMIALLENYKKNTADIDGMSDAFVQPLGRLNPAPAGVTND